MIRNTILFITNFLLFVMDSISLLNSVCRKIVSLSALALGVTFKVTKHVLADIANQLRILVRSTRFHVCNRLPIITSLNYACNLLMYHVIKQAIIIITDLYYAIVYSRVETAKIYFKGTTLSKYTTAIVNLLNHWNDLYQIWNWVYIASRIIRVIYRVKKWFRHTNFANHRAIILSNLVIIYYEEVIKGYFLSLHAALVGTSIHKLPHRAIKPICYLVNAQVCISRLLTAIHTLVFSSNYNTYMSITLSTIKCRLLAASSIIVNKAYVLSVLVLFISYVLIGQSGLSFVITIVPTVLVLVPMYLLWQTAHYFSRVYSISKYTTQVAAFWQRSFTLFWVLEISLYLVFVFIWFISPEAPSSVVWQRYSSTHITADFYGLIKDVLLIVVLIAVSLSCTILKAFQNRLISLTMLFAILVATTSLLLHEFSYLVWGSSNYSDLSSVVSSSTANGTIVWSSNFSYTQELAAYESMFQSQMWGMLAMLKFAHIAFIYVMLCFILLRYFGSGSLSYEHLSVVTSCFNILLLFNLTQLVTYIKAYGKNILISTSQNYFMDSSISTLPDLIWSAILS